MEVNREPCYLSIELLNKKIHPLVDFSKPCPYSLSYLQAVWEGRVEVEVEDCSEAQTVRMNLEENPVDKKRKKDESENTVYST
jgi:hypothetical protein